MRLEGGRGAGVVLRERTREDKIKQIQGE